MPQSEDYLSFIREVGSTDKYTVQLVTAVDDDGEFYHAYLLMQADHIKYLAIALRTRTVDLTEYGIILAQGPGIDPLPETRQKVEAQFQTTDRW